MSVGRLVDWSIGWLPANKTPILASSVSVSWPWKSGSLSGIGVLLVGWFCKKIDVTALDGGFYAPCTRGNPSSFAKRTPNRPFPLCYPYHGVHLFWTAFAAKQALFSRDRPWWKDTSNISMPGPGAGDSTPCLSRLK